MAYLALETTLQYIPTYGNGKWWIWDMINHAYLSCEGKSLEFDSGDEAYALLKEMEDFR